MGTPNRFDVVRGMSREEKLALLGRAARQEQSVRQTTAALPVSGRAVRIRRGRNQSDLVFTLSADDCEL